MLWGCDVGMRCQGWCLAFISWHFPSAVILCTPFGLTGRTEYVPEYCPHGSLAEDISLVGKKGQSQLWTAVSFLLFFLSDGEGDSFFIQMYCIPSGEEIRAHRYGQKVCLHTQPPSHFSQHHLVSFWRKLREFRDCLRQGPLPSRGRRDKGRRCVPIVLFPGQVLPSLVQPSYTSWHGSLGRQAAGVSPPTRQDRTAVVKGMPRGGSCSSPKDLLDNCLVRQRKLYYLLRYSLKKALLGNFQVVQWLELGAFTAGSWVQFLVGELRSCKPCGAAPVPQKHLFRLSVVSQKREVRDGYLEF